MVTPINKKALQAHMPLPPYDMLHTALEHMVDSIIIIDSTGTVIYLNNAASQLIGCPSYDAYGKHWEEVVPFGSNALNILINQCLRPAKQAYSTPGTLLEKHETASIDIEVRASSMYDNTGTHCGAVLTLRDVSHTQKLVNHLRYQATHDALTRLVNRHEFEQRLERVLNKTTNHKTHALLYMDLDGFKSVNDSYGHSAGDEVLRQVANILTTNVRERDTLARLGGDEFALLLEYCSAKKALKVAQQIKNLINQHVFCWNKNKFQLDISIGINPLAEEHLTIAQVIVDADLACYESKKLGNGPAQSKGSNLTALE